MIPLPFFSPLIMVAVAFRSINLLLGICKSKLCTNLNWCGRRQKCKSKSFESHSNLTPNNEKPNQMLKKCSLRDSDSGVTRGFKINGSDGSAHPGSAQKTLRVMKKGRSRDEISQPQSPETFTSWPSRRLLLSPSVKRSPLATRSIGT